MKSHYSKYDGYYSLSYQRFSSSQNSLLRRVGKKLTSKLAVADSEPTGLPLDKVLEFLARSTNELNKITNINLKKQSVLQFRSHLKSHRC